MRSVSVRAVDVVLGAAVEVDLVVLVSWASCWLACSREWADVRSVVERTVVSESVPLGTRLRVESQDVVVHGPRGFVVYSVLKAGSVEAGSLGLVEGPVCTDSDAVLDFFRRRQCVLCGQTVQHPQLVCGTEESPGVPSWAILLEREVAERWGRWGHCGVILRRYFCEGGMEWVAGWILVEICKGGNLCNVGIARFDGLFYVL